MELKKSQRKVMNERGSISIVGQKIWSDPAKMARLKLTLIESADDVQPVAVNLKAPAEPIKNEDLKAKLDEPIGIEDDTKQPTAKSKK